MTYIIILFFCRFFHGGKATKRPKRQKGRHNKASTPLQTKLIAV